MYISLLYNFKVSICMLLDIIFVIITFFIIKDVFSSSSTHLIQIKNLIKIKLNIEINIFMNDISSKVF